MVGYYVDTCIWLNLFKKEEGKVPYWMFAKDFLEKVMFSKDIIYYSGFILRELEFVLNDQELFKNKLLFFKEEKSLVFVKAKDEDYVLARKIESDNGYKIGFYDCLHVAIAKRMKSVLVTRDNDLIFVANKYVLVSKPEDLIS